MVASMPGTPGLELLRQLILECRVRCHHEGMLFSRLQDVRLAEGMLQVSRDGIPELHIHLSDAVASCRGADVVVEHNSGKQALTMSFRDAAEAQSWTHAMQNAISAWDNQSHDNQLDWPMQQMSELAQLRAQLTLLKQQCVENDRRCRESANVTNGTGTAERQRLERIAALESEAESKEQRIAMLEAEVAKYKQDHAALTNGMGTAKSEQLERIAEMESEAASREQRIAMLEAEVNTYKQGSAALAIAESQRSERIAALSREAEGREQRIATLEGEVGIYKRNNAALVLKVEEQKSDIQALEMKNAEFRTTGAAESDTLQSELAIIAQAKAELANELEQERTQKLALQTALREELENSARAQAELEKERSQNLTLQQTLNEELALVERKNYELLAELEQEKQRNRTLEVTESAAEQMRQKLQARKAGLEAAERVDESMSPSSAEAFSIATPRRDIQGEVEKDSRVLQQRASAAVAAVPRLSGAGFSPSKTSEAASQKSLQSPVPASPREIRTPRGSAGRTEASSLPGSLTVPKYSPANSPLAVDRSRTVGSSIINKFHTARSQPGSLQAPSAAHLGTSAKAPVVRRVSAHYTNSVTSRVQELNQRSGVSSLPGTPRVKTGTLGGTMRNGGYLPTPQVEVQQVSPQMNGSFRTYTQVGVQRMVSAGGGY